MLLLLLHKPSKQSELSRLRPDTSSLVIFKSNSERVKTASSCHCRETVH